MTRQVWKFPLNLVDEPQVVRMPEGATVVHVGSQVIESHGPEVYGRAELLSVWAEVDPARNPVDRVFTVEGTGHPIHPDSRHVGTSITESGALVWHVYEVAP